MSVPMKNFEIFSGTGGVGKTTLAASRALYLAKKNKKVLLITIDPAKRLKELLNLNEENAGDVVTLTNPFGLGENVTLDAMLMNPAATMKRIAEKSNAKNIYDNRLLKILSKPYGGLNEILSVVELYFQREYTQYDSIILDTPPGSHFVDFLESVGKIRAFFDKKFIEIFNMLKKQFSSTEGSKPMRFIDKIVSTGFKPLLTYLEKVTGAAFVREFVEAVAAIYQGQEIFLNALNLQEDLKDPKQANWFLVTSFDQNKVHEAMELQAHAKNLLSEETYIILNKSNQKELKAWIPEEGSLSSEIKDVLVKKELILRDFMTNKFKNILEFQEIHKITPQEHVESLVDSWDQF